MLSTKAKGSCSFLHIANRAPAKNTCKLATDTNSPHKGLDNVEERNLYSSPSIMSTIYLRTIRSSKMKAFNIKRWFRNTKTLQISPEKRNISFQPTQANKTFTALKNIIQTPNSTR